MWPSENIDPTQACANIMKALMDLSSPYEVQVALINELLRENISHSDALVEELGYQFQDASSMGKQLFNANIIDRETLQSIEAVREFISAKFDPLQEEFWSLRGLEASQDWRELRDLARISISKLPAL